MPKVDWGVSSRDVDNFDREKQFKPYDGPIPSNGVYRWRIKVLKFIAGTQQKLPQLRIGLELLPRKGRKDERGYAGYFIMIFPPVSNNTQFRYVPFLDALGIASREFTERTITDNEGNITRIGKWRNDGEQVIKAALVDGSDQNGNPRKDIGWIGSDEDDEPEAVEDDDEEDYDEDDDDSDSEDDDGWD